MKFCSEFNEVLTFLPDRIQSCCVVGYTGPVYFEITNRNLNEINFDYFKYVKNVMYKKYTEENLDNFECKNCFYLKDKSEEDNFSLKYSLIYLNNWAHCNCGCFYCDRLSYTKGIITNNKKKSDYYDVLPVIKGLYKNNLLDKEKLRVVFHGGDFTVLKEFDELCKTFIKNGVNKIDFSSNNIIYKPIVSRLIKQNKASLYTSLDSGTQNTYKLIKRVDKFNQVIKNIKRYVQESRSDNPEIVVKYILLNNVNDNEQELITFIKLMKQIGITRVSLQLEHRYAEEIIHKKVNIPNNYKNLISLFYELCKSNNIYTDDPDNIMNYIMNNQNCMSIV